MSVFKEPSDIRSFGIKGEKTVRFQVGNLVFDVAENVLNGRRDDILELPCHGILPEDVALWMDGVACGVAKACAVAKASSEAASSPKRSPDTPAKDTASALPDMLHARLFLVRKGIPYCDVKALSADDVRETVRQLGTNEEVFSLIDAFPGRPEAYQPKAP
jgi:hypothetical protein